MDLPIVSLKNTIPIAAWKHLNPLCYSFYSFASLSLSLLSFFSCAFVTLSYMFSPLFWAEFAKKDSELLFEITYQLQSRWDSFVNEFFFLYLYRNSIMIVHFLWKYTFISVIQQTQLNFIKNNKVAFAP